MAKPKDQLAVDDLFAEVRQLIDEARTRAATAVNAELTLLYWTVGQRIQKNVLQEKRADYGQQTIRTLAQQLSNVYGSGWGEKQLRHCLHFAETFPDEQIVYTVCRQLSWSKLRMLMYLNEPLKRNFYLELARLENWSVRQLRERIDSQLFERTAISRKGEETIRHDLERLRTEGKVSADLLLKDPYILSFLGLEDRYLEKDLEDAILRELENFLLELGAGFSFVARQKRIQIDRDDYFIDLLLYNRKLKRLVAIDLKIGEFEAGFKGQDGTVFTLARQVRARERRGITFRHHSLYGEKREHIELLELGKSDIHVAEYLTVLPPKKVLQAKLQAALDLARERLEARHDDGE